MIVTSSRFLALATAAALVLGAAVPATAVVGDPVDVPTPAPRVRITGSGWGHGVGLSQYGARAQARAGWGAGRIVRYWYPGVRVVTTTASQRPITVGLSSTARAPTVRLSEGTGRWVACTPRCTAVRTADGAPLRQRVADGAWSVVAEDGTLSLRDGARVLWSAPAPATLRLRLSFDDRRRAVAHVLGRRYRWGAVELGQWTGAQCRRRRVCVNVRVPSVERYLRGVAEMPSSWEAAALGAQAVVARTFALRARAAGLRDACRCHLTHTPADQAYAGLDKEEGVAGDRWTARVDATAGRVVTYGGALAATFYSSSHGRRSEHISDSYAFSAPLASYPYLRSVADPWSSSPAADNPYARWTTTVGNREFAAHVDRRLRRVTRVVVGSRTRGTTPRELIVSGTSRSGAELTVAFAGREGKPVGATRTWIAGADLKQRFSLRSQQIRRIGFAPFVDDDGSEHEYALLSLAVADVFDGCRADRSCHDAGLRRALAADMLARALRLPTTGGDRFVDDDASPYEAAIDAVAAAGVVVGCTASGSSGRRSPSAARSTQPGSARFCPDRILRRGQLASLLARAFELPGTDVDAFGDDDGSVHEDNIDRLAAAGIALGATGGRFRPRRRVSVGQMAAFLTRALDAVAAP